MQKYVSYRDHIVHERNTILPTELHTIKTQVCVKFQLDQSVENGKTVKK